MAPDLLPILFLQGKILATLRAGLPLRLLNGSGLRDGRQALAGEAEIAEDEKRDPR